MKKVIVSGANGFVGSHTVKYLLDQGVEVVALCHAGHCDHLPQAANLTVVPFDLHDVKQSLADISVSDYDFFYHFAWDGSAGTKRADTKLQLANAQWTVETLIEAKRLGCKKFVGAGSIMEHETMIAAYTNGNRPGLGYIYGAGKTAAHMLCMSKANELGIDLVWGEITNAYGVGELSPRMVNTTLRKCLKGKKPQFTAGTQNYDFIYIDDVARAFYLLGQKGKAFHEYVIGSGQAKPLKEFLLEMKEAVAPDLDFIFGDVPFTGINLPLETFATEQTFLDTGFKAQVSFGQGTQKTYAWLASLEEE